MRRRESARKGRPPAHRFALSQQASQFCESALYDSFETCELGENLFRRNVVDMVMHNLLVSIDAQIVSVRRNLCLGNTEALGSPWTPALVGLALPPSCQHVRQIVLR